MDERYRRYSDEARRVLRLARDEAVGLRHNYVGTEHVLLGLLGSGDGASARALAELGVDRDLAHLLVVWIIGRGDRPVDAFALTPRAKRALALADREADRLGHESVRPEHLLLGLLREGAGIAVGVLEMLGIDLAALSARVEQAPTAPPALQPPLAPRPEARRTRAQAWLRRCYERAAWAQLSAGQHSSLLLTAAFPGHAALASSQAAAALAVEHGLLSEDDLAALVRAIRAAHADPTEQA